MELSVSRPSYNQKNSIPRKKKMTDNNKWVCISCGYIYDPAVGDSSQGIAGGTAFEDIPEQWKCPICYADKDHFDPL